MKQSEIIERLVELGVEYSDQDSYHTLVKILKVAELAQPKPDATLKVRDVLVFNPKGKIKAEVEAILPAGMDSRYPFTRYKIVINNERHLFSETLIKELFERGE